MLVLSRRIGQRIIIGDDIEIVVLQSPNQAVRLGINAPRQCTVHRLEVYQKIQAAQPLTHEEEQCTNDYE